MDRRYELWVYSDGRVEVSDRDIPLHTIMLSELNGKKIVGISIGSVDTYEGVDVVGSIYLDVEE